MNHADVLAWIDAYEQAWRSPGIAVLGDLFTQDAVYSQGPYKEPCTGLPAIMEMWEETRDGPDEIFRMTRSIVAVEGDTAVARVEVWYGEPVTDDYRDLWIMHFASDGRCASYEEWPFWPLAPITAAES